MLLVQVAEAGKEPRILSLACRRLPVRVGTVKVGTVLGTIDLYPTLGPATFGADELPATRWANAFPLDFFARPASWHERMVSQMRLYAVYRILD